MFDIAFSELFMVVLVALLLLGPKEAVSAVTNIKSYIMVFKKGFGDYMRYLEQECSLPYEEPSSSPLLQNEIINYIVDLEGNLQATYDLTSLMPEIQQHEENDQRKRKTKEGEPPLGG